MTAPAPSYNNDTISGLGIAFTVIPVCAFAVRIWAKWTWWRRSLRRDDYVLFVGLVFAVAINVTQIVTVRNGDLGSHYEADGGDHNSGSPREQLADPRFVFYERTKLAVLVLFYPGVALIKASLLMFYMDISQALRASLLPRLMLAAVAAWAVSFFFANLLVCNPISPFFEPFYGFSCFAAPPVWYAACSTDFLMDVLILVLPVRYVIKLQRPRALTVGFIATFMTGVIICAMSLTRLVMYAQVAQTYLDHDDDVTYYTSPLVLWSSLEISLAVVGACLPTYWPLWLRLSREVALTAPENVEVGYQYPYNHRHPYNDHYSHRLQNFHNNTWNTNNTTSSSHLRQHGLVLPSMLPGPDSLDLPRTPPGESRGRVRRVSVATAAAEAEAEAEMEARSQIRISALLSPEEVVVEEEQGENSDSYIYSNNGRPPAEALVDADGPRYSDPPESVINAFPLPPMPTARGRNDGDGGRTGTISIGMQRPLQARLGQSLRR